MRGSGFMILQSRASQIQNAKAPPTDRAHMGSLQYPRARLPRGFPPIMEMLEGGLLRVPIVKTTAAGRQQTYWAKPSWQHFDNATRQLFVTPPEIIYGGQTPEAETRRATRAIFGRDLDDSTWGRLVAGVGGSQLHLNGYEDEDTGGFGVYADVVESPITSYAEREVHLSNESGQPYMRNIGVVRAPGAPARSVRKAIAVQIMTARALGLHRINLDAAGPPDNGYAVWPLLGFDGPLEQGKHDKVIQEFQLLYKEIPRMVSDVATRDYDLWLSLGGAFRAEFLLSSNGAHWDILLKYLWKEGIYRP